MDRCLTDVTNIEQTSGKSKNRFLWSVIWNSPNLAFWKTQNGFSLGTLAHCRYFSTTNMWWQSIHQVAIRETCPEPIMPVFFLSSVCLCLVLCSALCWINSTELPKTTGGQLKKQNIKQNSGVHRHLSRHLVPPCLASLHPSSYISFFFGGSNLPPLSHVP